MRIRQRPKVTDWTGGGLHARTNPISRQAGPLLHELTASPSGFKFATDLHPNQGIYWCDQKNVYTLKGDYGKGATLGTSARRWPTSSDALNPPRGGTPEILSGHGSGPDSTTVHGKIHAHPPAWLPRWLGSFSVLTRAAPVGLRGCASSAIRAGGSYYLEHGHRELSRVPSRPPGPDETETTLVEETRHQRPAALAEHRRTTIAERAEVGRTARRVVSRSSHAGWTPGSGRRDPVRLLEEQNATRVPWLVPLRHARMRVSPFTFYRGTARIMAADLATTETSGLAVQLGGDAHLSNFGAYASPSRQLVFDQNDFDETLPGPWEWDVKRFATSFLIAARDLEFDTKTARALTSASVRAYRSAMREYAGEGYLDLWHEHTTTADVGATGGTDSRGLAKRLARFERRARSKTSLQALAKLAEDVDGRYRIRSQPPVLVPLRDLPAEYDVAAIEASALAGFEAYKHTLSDDRRALVDRYVPLDLAIKVVGVGSVGTYSLALLLEGRDRDDPLFLQIKEAGPSVLEEFVAPSVYANHGRRVVEGQRLIQAESDICLGWTEGDLEHRHFYVRQLRDWKGSVEIAGATPNQLEFYAQLCGRVLARGHARSGDPVVLTAYMGKGDAFDRAITEFAAAYEVQNRADYDEFLAAIGDGRLPVADDIGGS